MNLFWFYFIVRVAVNVVLKDQVTDVRSDDEGEDEDEDLGKGLERVEGGKEGDGTGVDAGEGMNGHAVQRKIANGAVSGHVPYTGRNQGRKKR